MRILVTGSRNWNDGTAVEAAIVTAVRELGDRISPVTIVHGGARGADSIAESVAHKYRLNVECHPAAWDTRGRAAGVIRNSEMVNAGADVCLAFIKDQSRGASHCAAAAEKAGIPTRRFTA
jgi:hypothetical protein